MKILFTFTALLFITPSFANTVVCSANCNYETHETISTVTYHNYHWYGEINHEFTDGCNTNWGEKKLVVSKKLYKCVVTKPQTKTVKGFGKTIQDAQNMTKKSCGGFVTSFDCIKNLNH